MAFFTDQLRRIQQNKYGTEPQEVSDTGLTEKLQKEINELREAKQTLELELKKANTRDDQTEAPHQVEELKKALEEKNNDLNSAIEELEKMDQYPFKGRIVSRNFLSTTFLDW
eukprot:TRINITY_DN581_c0_g3_i2.p2 TRINITY_DN581_c0_g3~~TRINITY_DN581_c0_g3_i2.p2  ORF type:complete len:113 (-),score=33.95 TRINITY_DN581_c0_g3_i2:211-549(-)